MPKKQSARSSLALAGLRDVCTVNFVDCWQSPQSPRHKAKMYGKIQKRYELIPKMRGHAADAVAATKLYERVPNDTTRTN